MAVAATNKSAVLTAVLLLALALSGAGAGAPSPSATVEFSNEYYNPLDFDCYKGGAADGVAPGKSFSFEIHNLKYKNENAYICNIYDDTVATLQSRGYDRATSVRGDSSVVRGPMAAAFGQQ
ncbi:unnamed protein product [Cuscuta campestris]|uniref:Phytocyanin domain-containing protein n=1 Tax=Cuscuta campestris TaxID=132261 RepID=A0A484KBW6_9ASTE|nr:unnamed protein product [Cuscuta campestris]